MIRPCLTVLALVLPLAASAGEPRGTGNVGPGDKLPSARDLASSLGINMHTVLRAYTTLRDEGAIELRRGRGAVVTAKGLDTAELEQSARHLLDVGRRHGVTLAQLHTLLDQEASS